MTDLPSRARVVVVGGGIVGCSVAYHLTKLGWTDVLLLEQGHLSGGTTWHAAGLVGPLRASESGTRLVQYSAELYESLEAETGLATGYKNVGGVIVARTEDRLVQLKRTAANATAYDMECELVTPERAQELWPPMQVDDLLGALWLPGDGKVNPTDVTQSLAKGARMGGASIAEKVRVLGIDVDGRRVTGVRTDQGDVETEIVVNCAGQWAKALGDQVGVTVPLHSAEHFYVVTEAIDGAHPDLPIMRDPDGWTYFKEEVGGLVVGGFEPEAKPWRSPDDLPYPFEFQLLEEDWDHFSVLMDEALVRVPALAETGIRKFYNGPESFTPDNQFLLGAAPELDGFFVGAGFNSVGIASAGGAGRALAEWIVEGEPTSDLVGVDVRRFAPFHGDNEWLRSRVAEVLGLHYAVPWPNRELETARPQRVSPLHETLAAEGAVFGTRMGWERPNVFDPRGLDYSWGKPGWLAASSAEQRATRTGVAVFDQTSFSKYVVDGPGALEALQWICAADVDVAVDGCVYTPFLNARATYEADLTVTRTGDDEFLIVSSSATTIRDLDWLRRQTPAGLDVRLRDVTADFAVLGVMGPASRDLLAGMTDADLSEDGFPFATSRGIHVAGADLRATRMTYVGELGWELLVPVADAVRGSCGAGSRWRGQRGLLRDRVAAAREGLPGLRPRADTRLDSCGGRSALRDRAQGRQGLPRPRRPGGTSRPAGGGRSAKTRRVVRGCRPGADALGRRAGAPRRLARRPGHQRGLGRDGRDPRSAWRCLRSDGPVTRVDLERGGFQVDVAGERYELEVTLNAPL